MGCLSPWGACLILNNAFPILLSTFYPNLKLLNGHHFKGGAAGNGATPPRTAL